ncbi:MAG: Mrp/NBP35 family ATP-binding protein [Eggerthellaceae bacterium]|jgi:Mrp family chromosome partitioning ATPase
MTGQNENIGPESCDHVCSNCSLRDCHERRSPQSITSDDQSNITHVIGIVSGKGGVGKSLVTSLIASKLRRYGYAVGILDADITGPSIPKIFGVRENLEADDTGIIPAQTKSGIKMVSVNLLLPDEDTPVAWRGPLVNNIIRQFWSETHWGNLDYLLVDMPPGTSDVFLTVFQTLPAESIITVSTPQDLVSMIVGKAVNLADEMNVPVVGLVENMAYFVCPNCHERHAIFGKSQGARVAEKYGIPVHVELPLRPDFAELCDNGAVERCDVEDALDPLIAAITKLDKGQ